MVVVCLLGMVLMGHVRSRVGAERATATVVKAGKGRVTAGALKVAKLKRRPTLRAHLQLHDERRAQALYDDDDDDDGDDGLAAPPPRAQDDDAAPSALAREAGIDRIPPALKGKQLSHGGLGPSTGQKRQDEHPPRA